MHAEVVRSPEEYAEHVRDMLRSSGPWRFEITGLSGSGDLVDAAWRQTGPLAGAGPDPRPTVVEEHVHELDHRAGAEPAPPTPPVA